MPYKRTRRSSVRKTTSSGKKKAGAAKKKYTYTKGAVYSADAPVRKSTAIKTAAGRATRALTSVMRGRRRKKK